MELLINDAAIALGISPNTVRRRLAKGLLAGKKVSSKWFITVPDNAQNTSSPPPESDASLVEFLKQQIAEKDQQIERLLAISMAAALNAPKPRPWWRPW
jgi:hypothetical protein